MLISLDINLVEKISKLNKPAIIAISGFGGSGKTTLAQLLSREFQAPTISIDSFNKGLKEFSFWETMDYARFVHDIVKPFREGQNDFVFAHQDGEYESKQEKIHHNGILITEGVGLLRPETNKYFDFRIWIDCPINEAVNRGKQRDREVWKNPKDELWEGIWKKNDIEYFEKYKPEKVADFILKNC